MPAARDQAAEERFLRRLGIDMKRLRVELPGERDDVLGGESVCVPISTRPAARRSSQ